MRTVTRSLAAIASAFALTLAGTGVASAQLSSELSSQLSEQSSRFFDSDGFSTVERSLYNAGVDFGADSTGRSDPMRNADAKDADLDRGTSWTPAPGVTVRWYRDNGGHYDVFSVARADRQKLINYLNNHSFPYRGSHYGVHPFTTEDRYYVAVFFKY